MPIFEYKSIASIAYHSYELKTQFLNLNCTLIAIMLTPKK